MKPAKVKKDKENGIDVKDVKGRKSNPEKLNTILLDILPKFRLNSLAEMYKENPEYRDFIKAVCLFNLFKISMDIRAGINIANLDEEEHLVSQPQFENKYYYSLAGRNHLISLVENVAEKTEKALNNATLYPVIGKRKFPVLQDIHLLEGGNPGSRNKTSSKSYRKIMETIREKHHLQFTGIFDDIVSAYSNKPFDYSYDTEKFILICSETKYFHIPDISYNDPFRDAMLQYVEASIKKIKCFKVIGKESDDYSEVLNQKLQEGVLSKEYITGRKKTTEYERLDRGKILLSFIIWGIPDIFSHLDEILENRSEIRTDIPFCAEPNHN